MSFLGECGAKDGGECEPKDCMKLNDTVDAVGILGMKILAEMSKISDNNIAFSPLIIASSMAMVRNSHLKYLKNKILKCLFSFKLGKKISRFLAFNVFLAFRELQRKLQSLLKFLKCSVKVCLYDMLFK